MDASAQTVVVFSLHNAVGIFQEKEKELGRLDAAAGDGDHGATMVRGLAAASAAIDSLAAALVETGGDCPAGEVLVAAGDAFADAAGGASGALFGALLTTVGRKLPETGISPAAVCAALQAGTATVAKLGKAAPGDKTMIDALSPFVAAFTSATQQGQAVAAAWHTALPAAVAGADSTAGMVAKRGRAARLGARSLGTVDPGAQSVVYLLNTFDEVLQALCK
jgi:dihydroxyacetone kinase phosphoprotein-dependent L subunit